MEVERTCRVVVGKDQVQVEEASDGRDLEILEPENVLQPC